MLIIILIAGGVFVSFFLLTGRPDRQQTDSRFSVSPLHQDMEIYRNSLYGISFQYRVGENGYVLREEYSGIQESSQVFRINLYESKDASFVQPIISFSIYPVEESVQSAKEWVEYYSNQAIPTFDATRMRRIADVPAFEYSWGAMQVTSIAFIKGGFVYDANVTPTTLDGRHRNDFEELLKSLVVNQ